MSPAPGTAHPSFDAAVKRARQEGGAVLSTVNGSAERTPCSKEAVLPEAKGPAVAPRDYILQLGKVAVAVAVWAVASCLALCATVSCVRSLGLTFKPLLIAWMALVEPLFWVWDHRRAQKLDAQPANHVPTDYEPMLHFKRVMAHARFFKEACHHPIDWRSYLSKWFKDAPSSAVKLGNLREMLAYGFFYATPAQLQADGRWQLVEQMTAEVAEEVGCSCSWRISDKPTSDTSAPAMQAVETNTSSSDAADGPANDDASGINTRQAIHHEPSSIHNSSSSTSGTATGSGSKAEPTRGVTSKAAPTWHAGLPAQQAAGAEAELDEVSMDEVCVDLSEGYTPGLSFMAHLWEPLHYFHRPLLWYLIVEWLHLLTRTAMAVMGMRRMRVHGTVFYYTQGKNRLGTPCADDSPPQQAPLLGQSQEGQQACAPLVLLHGVGVGLLGYMLIVCRLVASGQPLLVPQFRHVSMRICTHIPQADEVAAWVVAAMKQLGWNQGSVIAHSYGTFVASCMVQRHRSFVHSLTLIDPVCFGMFLPDLLYNFVYRTPLDVLRTARTNGLWPSIRGLAVFLMSRDVALAATFCRKFYWVDCNLWPEDMPPRTLVVLAGADELLHAQEIRHVLSGQYKGVPRDYTTLSAPATKAPAEACTSTTKTIDRVAETTMANTEAANPSRAASASSASPLLSPTGSATSPLTSFLASSDDETSTLQPAVASTACPDAASATSANRGATRRLSDARVLYHPNTGHASFLVRTAVQAEVVEQVLSLAHGEAADAHVSRRVSEGEEPLLSKPQVQQPSHHVTPSLITSSSSSSLRSPSPSSLLPEADEWMAPLKSTTWRAEPALCKAPQGPEEQPDKDEGQDEAGTELLGGASGACLPADLDVQVALPTSTSKHLRRASSGLGRNQG